MAHLKEDIAYKISHNWFLINDQDRLIVNNVSIGLVLQIIVFEYFYRKANETRRCNGLKGLGG